MSRKRVCLAAVAVGLSLGALYVGGGSAAPGGGQLWVTAQDASRIHIVYGDGDTVATIQLPNGTSPHFARLSPSGQYAYVPSLGYGTVTVIRTRDRHVFDPLPIAPAILGSPCNSNPALPGCLGTHDAKPSPDGSVVLAAQWSDNSVYKIDADEASEEWEVETPGTPMPGRPICIVFDPKGEKAYVGTVPGTTPGLPAPSATILVVDVDTLAVDTTLPVVGGWSCSWAQTRDGSTMWLTTNAGAALDGPGGRLYKLDLRTNRIELYLRTGAPHIHGMGMSPDESTLYLTSRNEDRLQIVDLAAKTFTTIPLGDPSVADRPDSVAVRGGNVWVTLKSTGKFARFNADDETVEYVDLELLCPGVDAFGNPLPAPADPQLCYPVHSVDGGY